MQMQQQFKLKQSSLAVLSAVALLTVAQWAQAGAGWADNTDKSGAPFKQATFYANSPAGVLAAHGPANSSSPEGTTRDTGTALRKFVDSLPLVDGYVTNASLLAANKSALGRHIPTAIKESVLASNTSNPLIANGTIVVPGGAHSVSYPDADFYEIAVVEYREQLHSDLPPLLPDTTTVPGSSLNTGLVTGGTTLRGYVQIWTPNLPATDATGAAIKKTQLFYLTGKPILDNQGNPVYAVGDGPHYLGPIISSDSTVPVRLKFDNYLPIGHYDPITKSRGGDTFVPTDYTMPGCGLGPLGAVDPNAPQPFERYTQNRTNIHLHGGDTPWISDGGPHVWITPAGENTPYKVGASTQNVPDMPDPGPGSQTYFYPNNQSARMEWYHDHSYGSTRLDVYAGIVSAFIIHDAMETAMKAPAPTVTTPTQLIDPLTGLPAVDSLGNPVLTPVTTVTGPAGALYGMDEIPLIYEDKTFVPRDIAVEDAKWNQDTWGHYGDLWFPHVYEANQNPNSIDGTNPAGRWDYGPWFWPVFPAPLALPTGEYGNVSSTQEQYADTPLLNGIAYPNLNVEPKPYRFRLLNASLQRYLNLGFYVAEPVSVAVQNSGSGYAATATATLSADANGNRPTATLAIDSSGAIAAITLNPPPAGVTYKYSAAPTVTIQGGGAGTGATFVTSFNTEVPMIDAVIPPSGPVYGINTYDGRPGGIPDPAAIGPNIIHIGSEGGWLTQPNVIKSTPVSYEQQRKSVTVLNVFDYGLYVGPAERADFVVDFSQYAGKTLILYNDCPAPNPGFDTRTDYFTGDGDQTSTGGQDNTLPGYGPNTRTMMRVNVAATMFDGVTPPAAPYDPLNNGGPLATALPAAFAATQDKPIVPQSWQNKAYGTNYTDNTAHIYAGTAQQPGYTYNEGGVAQSLIGFQMDSAGTQYTIPPTVTFTGGLDPVAVAAGTAVQATAHAVLDVAGQRVVGIQLDTLGGPYLSAPTVALTGGDGIGASATAITDHTRTVQILNKGIQELFDNNYGRMNATFSTELPFTSVLAQTTVPLGYADPPTEQIGDGEVQFWKVTHNGVDAHVVHFHLFNVQVINRVGWDGTIKKINPAEFGWKETVKMMPLEDIYVAVKPKSPKAPFGVPQSIRLMDPTAPFGSMDSFTQVNPVTGLATTVTNDYYNFNWEYVWHCHILGHEENDFMRPMIFDFGTQQPPAVTSVSYDPTTLTVSWVDPTPAGVGTTYGNKQNEQGFLVQRSDTGTFDPLPQSTPQSAAMASMNPNAASRFVVAANATSWTDITPVTATTVYRVLAFNSAGYSPSALTLLPGTSGLPVSCNTSTATVSSCVAGSAVVTTTAPTRNVTPGTVIMSNVPTGLSASVGAFNYTNGSYPITLSWDNITLPANGFLITRTGGTNLLGNILPDATFNVSYATAQKSLAAAQATIASQQASNATLVAAGSPPVVYPPTPAYTFTDLGAVEISGYKYTVQADYGTKAVPVLSPNSYVDVVTGYAPPLAINNVKAAISPSGNGVVLNWDAPPLTTPDASGGISASSHVTAYNIVRTAVDASGKLLAPPVTYAVQQLLNPLSATNSLPPATTFTDTSPLPGISATYTVYGVNGNVIGTSTAATAGSSSATITFSASNTGVPGMNGAHATAISPTSVQLVWSPAPASATAVNGVSIVRISNGVSTTLVTTGLQGTTFIDTNLSQNTAYTYSIAYTASGAAGVAETTNPVTTPFAPALPVTGLSATENLPTASNTLVWTAGGPTVNYVVSRAIGTSTTFTTLSSSVTGTTFTDLTPGVGLNTYKVQAVNGPNVSAAVTASVTDAVVPVAPTTLTTAVVAGAVNLTWNAGGTGTTAYVVQRSTDGISWTTLNTVTAPTLSYADTSVVASTTYQYRVLSQITPTGGTAVISATSSPVGTAYYLLQNGASLGAVTVRTTAPVYTVTAATATATATSVITVPFARTTLANAPAVTGYNLWAYVNGAAAPTKLNAALLAANATTTSYTAPVGSSYAFYVTEVNILGESAAPAAATLTTVYNGLPAPKLDAAVTPVRNAPLASSTTDSVTVDWSPLEASVNGAAATGYVVQWSNSATNFAANGNSGGQTLTLAQATSVGAVTSTGATSAVSGSGSTAAVKTTFSAVVRGGTAAVPTNTIYFRVNTVSGATTSYGAVQVLNQNSLPKLP